MLDELDVKLALEWREHSQPDRAWAARYGYDFDVAIEFLKTCQREVEKEIRQRRRDLIRARASALVLGLLLMACMYSLWTIVKTRYIFEFSIYYQGVNSALNAIVGGNLPEANRALENVSGTKPRDLGVEWHYSKDLRGFEWYYLWWAGHNEWATITRQNGSVPCVAFAAHSNLLAAGDVNGNVMLWTTGISAAPSDWKRPTPQLQQPYTAPVTAIVFSPDGSILAAGYANGDIRQWNTNEVTRPGHTSGAELTALKRYKAEDKSAYDSRRVFAIAFSPDGSTLVAGYADGAEWRWDLKSGESKSISPPVASSPISMMAFSPDGSNLAIAYADGNVLWESAESGQGQVLLSRYDAQEKTTSPTPNFSRIFSIAFSPDKKWLVAGYADGFVAAWDLTKGKTRSPRLLGQAVKKSGNQDSNAITEVEKKADNHHLGPVFAAVFKDEHTLATGSADSTVKLWDLNRPVGEEFLLTRKGHMGGVLSLAVSPDKTTLASGSDDGSVKTWATQPQEEPTVLEDQNISAVAFSAKGDQLATGDIAGNIKLRDISTLKEVNTLPYVTSATINSVAFSPLDSALLAVGSEDGSVQLVRTDNKGGSTKLSRPVPPNTQVPPINSVAFSPDGKTLLAGSADGVLYLWSIDTRELSNSKKISPKSIYAVAFSPNGSIIATGDEDGGVRLWDAKLSQKPSEAQQVGVNVISSLAFSPDGNRLVMGSRDGTVSMLLKKESWIETWLDPLLKIFGSRTKWGETPLTLKKSLSEIHSLAFGPKAVAIVIVHRKEGKEDYRKENKENPIDNSSTELLYVAKENTIARQQISPKE
ncbi:MAG: hypothetical protein DMF64_19575 [Acidobacteria bacterium]|nr:MAG: hypothetical protein DMF64_19575 [Acidobacteriota bacterium]